MLGRPALLSVERGRLEIRGPARRSVETGELALLSGDQRLMIHCSEDAMFDVLLLHPRFFGETMHWLFPVVGGWPALLRSMQLQLDAAEVFGAGPVRAELWRTLAGDATSAAGRLMAIASALLSELQDDLASRLQLVLPLEAGGGGPTAPRIEVRRAQSLLDERYDEVWTNERLAEEIGISVSSLRRAFQDGLGMTPMQYLREVRRGRFEQLITLGDTDIEQAARRVGLVSTGHLRDFIRERYGMSPSQLREHARRLAS